MELTDRVGLDAATLAEVTAVVEGHATLERVVAWSLAQQGAGLVEVVVQDEFTHDVVLRWRERLVLVYDTT